MSALEDAPFTLLLRNCRVATMAANASTPYGAVLDASIGVAGERIAFVGPTSTVPRGRVTTRTEAVDLGGRWVTPGLVDCHTHVVYGGARAAEWELKLKGATYEEVALAGGGIVNTVGGTRAAGVDGLVAAARPRVEAMLRCGVTCLEIKSGYGLNLARERAQLAAA